MSIFEIDQKKCVRCGICTKVCPTQMIILQNENIPTADMSKVCINCGHCLSACPNGALSLKNMPLANCYPVEEDLNIEQEKLEHFIKSRRSIRNYLDKSVEIETLSRLIELVRYSPSIQNSQDLSWVVVHDREIVKRMAIMAKNSYQYFIKKEPSNPQIREMQYIVDEFSAGKDHICMDAPHIIVVFAPKDNIYSMVNCITALSYLELIIPSLGLGSCRIEAFEQAAKKWPPLQNSLGFPKSHNCFGAISIGYPKFKYHRLPIRNNPTIIWHKNK